MDYSIDFDLLSAQLVSSITENTPIVPETMAESIDIRLTIGVHRILQRAKIQAHQTNTPEANGADVLMEIFAEYESPAVYFLHQQGLSCCGHTILQNR